MAVGFPSPPGPLRTRQDNTSSIILQWNEPTYTGNELPIQKYIITISGTNYSEEVERTAVCIRNGSQCSHILTADGRDVEFNTTYLVTVELTAVNTCDLESISATLNMEIVACGEFSTDIYSLINVCHARPVCSCTIYTLRPQDQYLEALHYACSE